MDPAVRELTKEALDKRAILLRKEIFEMKIKKGFGQLEGTALPKVKRRELARLLTVRREDELGLRALKGTRTELEEKKPAAKVTAKTSAEAPASTPKSRAEAAKAKEKEEAGKPGKAKGFFDRFRIGRRSGARGR